MDIKRKIIAVFDLDNTLINTDCEKSLIIFLRKKKIISKKDYINGKNFYTCYKIGKLNVKKYYLFFSKILNKIKNFDIEIFYENIVSKFNKKIYKILNYHKINKHICLISTSSCYIFLLKKISIFFGIKYILHTSLETKNGFYTGNILGTVNINKGKVKNLLRWIKIKKIEKYYIYFYSDSINDLPLFKIAYKSFAINSDKQLRKIALKNNIKII